MRSRFLLRTVAVAIAIAGAVDPAWTRGTTARHRLSIVVIERHPATSSPSDSRLWSMAAALRTALESTYESTVSPYTPQAATSACPADGRCILISNGGVPTRVTTGAEVIGGLLVADPRRGVTIQRVEQPDHVDARSASRMNVWLHEASTIRGRPVVIRVSDHGMLVGEQEATLAGAPIAVDWTPTATGSRRLRVAVMERDGTQELERDSIDVAVQVENESAAVLIYEPEPTWLGTFVRRALEEDPRFTIDVRTRFGPGIIVGTNRGRPLTAELLGDKRAVIVAAPAALTADEVALLERFAVVRGGSVILLPDRRPSGPSTRLMPAIAAERRETQAQTVGTLTASELLMFDASTDGMLALVKLGEHPVIVSRALGRGRVIVSGALDAWRYRDDAFNRYWPSLVSDAAHATGPPLRASLDSSAVRPGEITRLTVEWRAMEGFPEHATVSARLVCEDDSKTPVRLWPASRASVFEGSVRVSSPTTCSVVATVTEPVQLEARTTLLVASDVATITAAPGAFAAAVQAHGGTVVSDDRLQSLVDEGRRRASPQPVSLESRPMRSPWWIIAFAGCLAGEWWLRRRSGLR